MTSAVLAPTVKIPDDAATSDAPHPMSHQKAMSASVRIEQHASVHRSFAKVYHGVGPVLRRFDLRVNIRVLLQ